MKHTQGERRIIFDSKKVHCKEHVVLGLAHKYCAAKNPTFVVNNSAENA